MTVNSSPVAVSGIGEVSERGVLFAWVGLIAITGFIFWATLNPPRLPFGR